MLRLCEIDLVGSKEELALIPQGKVLINTINAHSYNVAQKDEEFAEALRTDLNIDVKKADGGWLKADVNMDSGCVKYLIPDGASIVKACRWLKGKSMPKERIAGWDLFAFEMERLNTHTDLTDPTDVFMSRGNSGNGRNIYAHTDLTDPTDFQVPQKSRKSQKYSSSESRNDACINWAESRECSLKANIYAHTETTEKISNTDDTNQTDNSPLSTRKRVMFMGSSERVLEKIKERAAKDYPNLEVVTYSPPYKAVFSEEDNRAIIQAINEANPDLLWIGMTAPKQEKWTYQHWKELDIHCHVGTIGAVFDFYAGTAKRAPMWWQEHGVEWLFRLLKEPKRMWRRYVIGNPLFLWNTLWDKF